MTLVRLRPLLCALLLVAAVAGLAACGGGRGAGGGGSGPPESAAYVPSDVPVFLSLATDFESDQWQTAEALVQRFPGGGDALRQLDEFKASVGPEVGIAVLELPDVTGVMDEPEGSSPAADNPPLLLVTKPSDPAGLEQALAESDDRPVWRVVDGWYVVASDQAALDAAEAAAASSSLADSGTFGSVLDELPGDALARLYVGGTAVGDALQQGLAGNPLSGLLGGLGGAGQATGFGLSVRAEPEGVRVEGVAVGDAVPAAESFAPSLTSLVPADALAYVSFKDVRTSLEAFLDMVSAQTPDFDQQLGQIQLALGVSLTDDLLPLFEGEHALVVRAGVPIPEVTLVLSPADPARGLATLDKLTSGVPALAQIAGDDIPFTVTPTTIAGVPVKQVSIPGQDVSLYYGLVGDHIVLTTAAKGIADVAAPGESIENDPLYQQAAEAAGLPDETTGLAFVNLQDALSLLRSLPTGSGITVPDELGSLEYVVLYGEGGSPQRFTGFVGIG